MVQIVSSREIHIKTSFPKSKSLKPDGMKESLWYKPGQCFCL